ncbi:LysE family translocator (plasmid) [Paracoccus sp. TK19116]|uniref:LysE family translocator n=1 Tax=Paracoccus albicereus TaxID=2922394 RepID=A0ABT1MRF1_9RHOB|nr:LysE family translocator [Paracoccus albicereus]MCQ0969466.1 LysE family translocator [Paracoccus albicereus]
MIWDTIANIPLAQLLTFIAGGLVINIAPGQDVFFASACGIQGGPRAGMLAGIGVGFGVLFHVTLATIGLGALVAAHPEALRAIKYTGAAYLLWLAWNAWHAGPVDSHSRGSVQTWNILRRGAMSNILNPKPVLFLLAFLPQFTKLEYGPIWQQTLSLGLIFAFFGTVATVAYGLVAGYAGQLLVRRMGVVNKIAAVMFAGLAVRLVAK